MFIAILGRQPELGLAELERRFGASNISRISTHAVTVNTKKFDIDQFGGVVKVGTVTTILDKQSLASASQQIIEEYYKRFIDSKNKITFGISVYDNNTKPYDIQRLGLGLKRKLRTKNVSLRLIPNVTSALSSAVSYHNKLGSLSTKVELMIVRSEDSGSLVLAETKSTQNITAYSKRDQARPKRDAFVGMLPPKLAQTIINLALGDKDPSELTLLDPFCGTGVILQEAGLMGFKTVVGTDISDKMIEYSKENLDWLKKTHCIDFDYKLATGNAMSAKWDSSIDLVVSETYLGQPFSAFPEPHKFSEVKHNCNNLVTMFLKNLNHQITPDSVVCLAVPAWVSRYGTISHLPLIEHLEEFGYKRVELQIIRPEELIYHRPNQVVARELLILQKNN